MGREILYCAACANRVDGTAVLHDGRRYCPACAPAKAPPPTPATARRGHSTARIPLPAPPPSRLRPALWIGAALTAAALLAFLLVPGRTPPPVAVDVPLPPPAPKPAPPPPPVDPRELAARDLLRLAREAGAGDLDAAARAFETALQAARGTPLEGEADRELAAVEGLRRDRDRAALDAILKDVEPAVQAEEFGRALALLEKGRAADRLQTLRREIERRLEEAVAKGIERRKAGSEADVAALAAKIGKWGHPPAAERFAKALAAVPVPAAPPSPEELAYRAKWEAAHASALGGDLDAAVRALAESASAVKEPKLSAEAAGDVERLRGVRERRAAAEKAFGALAKDARVSLACLDPLGRPRAVEGQLLRAAPGWIAVKTAAGVEYVDAGDLAPEAEITLAGAKDVEADPLLRFLAGGPAEGLPPRYAALPRPPPHPRDPEARLLFAEAAGLERLLEDGVRRGRSTTLYRRLLADLADTPFVRRNRARLEARTEPAQEVLYFADDLVAGGDFRRAGPFWKVPAAGGDLQSTSVEFSFEATADGAWRAWAWIGACCAESVSLYWQATDLKDASAKGKSVEPGGNAASQLKPSIAKLPKTHAAHAKAPEPAAWAWLSLPLPKYAALGLKTIRLLSDRPGFAVGAAVASRRRASPPTEAQRKELEKTDDAFAGMAAMLSRGIVAHWKLDGDGADAAGGAAGAAVNGAGWGEGRVGGALKFDGQDDHFRVEHRTGLEPEQLTLACWFNAAAFRTGGGHRDWLVSKNTHEWTEGHFALMVFGEPKAPGAYLNIGGGRGNCFELVGPRGALDVNRWAHLAMTYDGAALKIFLDGASAGALPVNRKRTPGNGPLMAGMRPDAFAKFRGAIDDVRLYDRVLGDAELRLLAAGR